MSTTDVAAALDMPARDLQMLVRLNAVFPAAQTSGGNWRWQEISTRRQIIEYRLVEARELVSPAYLLTVLRHASRTGAVIDLAAPTLNLVRILAAMERAVDCRLAVRLSAPEFAPAFDLTVAGRELVGRATPDAEQRLAGLLADL